MVYKSNYWGVLIPQVLANVLLPDLSAFSLTLKPPVQLIHLVITLPLNHHRSVHLTTPTNLFGFWNIRSISRTLRKVQVKPGLNVRLILQQIRYFDHSWAKHWTDKGSSSLSLPSSTAKVACETTPRKRDRSHPSVRSGPVQVFFWGLE